MVNRLASPTFVTGPSDKLAAVDVYRNQQQTGQVVNSIRNILQSYNPVLARSLAGFNTMDIQSIARAALNIGGSSNNMIGQQLLNRAMSTNPNISGSIRSMDSGVRDQFGRAMGNTGYNQYNRFGNAPGYIGNGYGRDSQMGYGNYNSRDPRNLTCTVDDIQRPVSHNNYGRMSSIGSLLNSITGKQSIGFNDRGSQVGLHTAIIRECLDSNVSGITKDIFSVIGDRQIMSLVAGEVMPDVVRYSSTNDMYNISGGLYENELINAIPSLLSLFTKNFGSNPKSFYYNQGAQQHVKSYGEIIQAYNRTYPGWNRYIRNIEDSEMPETAIDISPLLEGTPTFNSIITAGATNSPNIEEKPYLLAPLITSAGVEQLLTRQYQRSRFYFDVQVNKVVNPRSLNKI